MRSVVVVLATASLAACGSSSSTSLLDASVGQEKAAVGKPVAIVSVAAIVASPESASKDKVISQHLMRQLNVAAEKSNFALMADKEGSADYTLRGYFFGPRDEKAAKVTYVWDVTDKAGQRINRISGEVPITARNPQDAWAAVPDTAIQQIAEKTIAGLAEARQTFSAGASAAVSAPMASGAPTAVGGAATGAPVAILVSDVTGAPGDGNGVLVGAMQRELAKKGIAVGPGAPRAYKVVGRVTLGAEKAGKRPIQIDWLVRDAAGKTLGNVAQKNELTTEMIDQRWSEIAGTAAESAVNDILGLVKPGSSTARAG